MSSTRSSPVGDAPGSGPDSTFDAAARSSRTDDNERAKVASVIPVSGTPSSSASWQVQRPVPFCSAWSTIESTSGPPVEASSFASTFAVISIRNDSRSPSFHSSNTPAMSETLIPTACRSRSYDSAISCMSAYSMPLCTIFT